MTSQLVWCAMNHATKAAEVRLVYSVMAQHNTVGTAFHIELRVERLVLQAPTARRNGGHLSAVGSDVDLQDSLQALPWGSSLEKSS
jgi:hypothetical protein